MTVDTKSTQITRRNHLLSALKITDNKIYNLLHEKIIFNSIDNNQLRDLRQRRKQMIVKIKYKKRTVIKLRTHKDDDIPFNGILNYNDANTYNTAPKVSDREMFNQSLLKPSPRGKIQSIFIAGYEIDTWYMAPYPEEYASIPVLYICEYCLKYMNSQFILLRHICKCPLRHPPGREIYKHESILIFEIDGRKETIYCQNLCLLLKLFLNSKTLYYDVDPFMFYVLTELDSMGNYHFVGYFSKEKLNSTNYNVSCILTLPIYQRKGYGNFLIEFSYLLTRREFKMGTPEKPLSDLGLLSYRNYWINTICLKLKELIDLNCSQVSILQLSELTGIITNDVVTLLEFLEFLIRNPYTGEYAIKLDLSKINSIVSKHNPHIKLKQENLLFKPMILGPSGGINTTSTMVVTDSDNQLMSGISLITNFMKDDIDDVRNIELQIIDDILKNDKLDEINLNDFLICYPGMDLRILRRDESDDSDDEILIRRHRRS